MIQQRLGRQPCDPPALRPERNQRDPDPRSGRRAAIRLGIAHQERPRDHAARTLDRRLIGARIGLADRQRVRPDHCAKTVPQAQLTQQRLGQSLGFVGADRQPVPCCLQSVQRSHNAGIKARMHRDRFAVMAQQAGIILILGAGRQEHLGAHPRIARPQHRAPALKGDQRIRHRVQQIAHAPRPKAGIGRRDQIARRIGQRPVQIKDHRSRHLHPPKRSENKGECARPSQRPPPRLERP